MPRTKLDNELAQYRRDIVRLAPEFSASALSLLGEGADNRAFLVGGSHVFRFAKHWESAAQVEIEIRLLALLAPHLDLPIPHYEYVGRQASAGLPFVGYRFIAGQELTCELVACLSPTVRERSARSLAGFLTALHAFPVEKAREAGVRDHDFRAGWFAELEQARVQLYPHLDGTVQSYLERTFRDYLDNEEHFVYRPALMHSDLAPEHVLFSAQEQRLTGIIDFDPVIGDPDYELLFVFWVGLGNEFLAHYPHPDVGRLLQKLQFCETCEIVRDVLDALVRKDAAFVESGLKSLQTRTRRANKTLTRW